MWICMVLGGLIASIPYLGPILMVPGYFACLIAGLVMAFLIVVGLLSVGLMMPAMAVNGKGAFDSWTAAYTYVIWGFSRFVVYSLIMGIIGAASIWAVYQLTGLLLGLVESSVNMGHVADDPWILPAGTAAEGFNGVLAAVVYFFKLLVQVVPFAYAFSYYWAASTVIFMLLRKQVDNVEFDEMCEAIPEASAEGEQELEITEVQPETGTAAEEDVTAPAEAALEEEPEGLEMGTAEEEPAADTSEPEETEAASGEPEEQEEPEPPQTSRAVEEEEAPAEEEAEPGEEEEDERVD
jgi:hypothetical protein